MDTKEKEDAATCLEVYNFLVFRCLHIQQNVVMKIDQITLTPEEAMINYYY